VVDPTAATAPWKSFVPDPNVRSAFPDYVQLLNSQGREVAPLSADGDVVRPIARSGHSRPVAGPERAVVRLLSRIRAWMVVPVVDFALMLAPLAWRPLQIHAIVTMAILALLFLTDGGRYVAPLHISVLDELPSIVTRLLAAVAAVSAGILYLYQKMEVLIFLQTACQAVA